MKFLVLAAVAALSAATPALAQDNLNFTGVRVAALGGYDDVTHTHDFTKVTYIGEAGVDVPVGERVTIGAEASTTNVFQRNRTIGVAARVGYAFDYNTLGFVKAGYSNYRDTFAISRNRSISQNLDGAQIGAGLEQKISPRTFLTAEYRYTNYSRSVGANAVMGGIGFHF